MTKPVVSVAAMALVERGELRLDQPVADLVPALTRLRVAVDAGTVPAVGAPTVQDLMRHTAGPGYGLGFAVRTAMGEAPFPGSPGDCFWSGVGGTSLWIDPALDLFAVLMLRSSSPEQRRHYRTLARDMVYAAVG